MTNSRLDRTPNSDVREMEEIDLGLTSNLVTLL